MTINKTVETALACQEAGADAFHMHARYADGSQTLDVSFYREAIDQLSLKTPDRLVQITTKAVGQYTPSQQRQVVREVLPQHVSVSIAEMMTDCAHCGGASYRLNRVQSWCPLAIIF